MVAGLRLVVGFGGCWVGFSCGCVGFDGGWVGFDGEFQWLLGWFK